MAQDDTIVSGVAGRYASALFSLAYDERQTDSVAEALARFDALIAESPDLERLVRSPVFSAADQLKALDAILADANIGGVAANFIRLVDIEAPSVLHPRDDRRLPQAQRRASRRDAGGRDQRDRRSPTPISRR